MADKHLRQGWAEKRAERAEKKRRKLEQTGDSPEKTAQHRKPDERDAFGALGKGVTGGGGGVGGGM